MLYKDIKNKSDSELHKLIADLKAELWTLRFKNATGQLDQSHKIVTVRHDIAKILTCLKIREQEAKAKNQKETKNTTAKVQKSEAKSEVKSVEDSKASAKKSTKGAK